MNLTWPLCPSWWSWGLLAHLSTPFWGVKFGEGDQKSFIPIHPTSYPAARDQHKGWFPLIIQPWSLWLLFLMGGSIFIPAVQIAEHWSSYPIPSCPIPSSPHALIPTCLYLPSTLSQICETAVSCTPLSIVLPKSYDSHVLLKIFYVSYDFFFCYFYSGQFSDGI